MKKINTPKPHKILVTGANSFVGRALVSCLDRFGFEVIGAVRRHEMVNGCTLQVVGDIDGQTNWQESLVEVDTVIHLAARVHVMCADDESGYHEVNVAGSLNLFEQAAEAGVKRFIYLSSVKVCGEASGPTPFREDMAPEPEGGYAQSKFEAEQGLFRAAKDSGLEVVVVRPPLVYGPHVRANFLRLLELVSRKIPLPFAALNNKRSMIYLENLTDFLRVCVAHPKASSQVFLVADRQDLSFVGLIRLISAQLKCRVMLIWVPRLLLRLIGSCLGRSREMDRICGTLQVDCTKVKTLLQWTPPYTTTQGVQHTLKWFLATPR